jgi:hypothetical protein
MVKMYQNFLEISYPLRGGGSEGPPTFDKKIFAKKMVLFHYNITTFSIYIYTR